MAARTAAALLLGAAMAVAGCTSLPRAEASGGALSAPPSTGPTLAGTPAHPGASSRGTAASPSNGSELPSRVVVRRLGIDLAVISGDATLPGNPPDYPLCGVAQYLTTYRYLGRDGTTTWIYAHAREGMFLPLLEASERRDGAALIGMMVDVYSTAERLHRYRIVEVLRHAVDRGIAANVPADTRRLVLQTSEGPNGTVPKLQVVAEVVEVVAAAPESRPVASPTACFIR